MPVYSDADPLLTISKTGNVKINYDAECVLQSVRNIFSTVCGERVRNPIGTRILRLLFQQMNADLARQIRAEIVDAITTYEPRVEIISFVLIPEFDQNYYDAKLTVSIAGLQGTYTMQNRLRSFTQ